MRKTPKGIPPLAAIPDYNPNRARDLRLGPFTRSWKESKTNALENNGSLNDVMMDAEF